MQVAVSFGGGNDLAIQVAGLMIPAKLAQRCLVQLQQDLAQLLSFGITRSETLPVELSQRADDGVSVFAADFTVRVAVAVIETCLAHATLHCARDRQHPPARTIWQERHDYLALPQIVRARSRSRSNAVLTTKPPNPLTASLPSTSYSTANARTWVRARVPLVAYTPTNAGVVPLKTSDGWFSSDLRPPE
jgi:hypothetical protein